MNENEILAEAIEKLNERVQKLENENEILRNNIEWLRLKLKKQDLNEYKTLIILKDISDTSAADSIAAEIMSKGYRMEWHKYDYDDVDRYSFICYDKDLKAIEDILTSDSIEFSESDGYDIPMGHN